MNLKNLYTLIVNRAKAPNKRRKNYVNLAESPNSKIPNSFREIKRKKLDKNNKNSFSVSKLHEKPKKIEKNVQREREGHHLDRILWTLKL